MINFAYKLTGYKVNYVAKLTFVAKLTLVYI